MNANQTVLFSEPDRFADRPTNAVTFRGKLGLPIHRWYRLTPSFSPVLAEDIAASFELGSNDYVLDPFSGVGTVPLCMKYRGIPAASIELNPYLYFVSRIKNATYTDLDRIARCFTTFIGSARTAVADLPSNPYGYLAREAASVPPIKHVERWWSPGNLAQLVCVRKLLLQSTEASAECRDLLRMGVLGILVPVSNAKHNHVSLTFADKPLPSVDVVAILEEKLLEMLADLKAVADQPTAEVKVHRGNSKYASEVLAGEPSVSAVITSPPYPNRFSYARETRPHMFFFEFIKDAKAVGQLETDAIGGTWGKATSILMTGVDPLNDVIEKLLEPSIQHLHGEKSLMANYVIKYFNDLYTHAAEIAAVCRPTAKLAYVIGNSKFYDHPLPSDEILAAIFGEFGFRLDRISRMRRRQSKTGLYEAVVFMSR